MPNNYQLIIAVSTGKVLKLLIITTSVCSEGGCLACFLFVLAPDRFHDPNSPPESDCFQQSYQGFAWRCPHQQVDVFASQSIFCPCTGLTFEPGHVAV